MLRLIILFSILHFTVRTFGQTPDCHLKKDSDGIKVYICKSDTSRFRSLRAEFVLENTSIEEFKTFMFTVSDYLKWQYNAIGASMLKKISEDEMIYRVVIDAPWPVDNREIIVQFSTVVHDADHGNFYINTVVSDYPRDKALIRIPLFQATWDIVRVNNSLQLTYNLNVDPGGKVPSWLVNMTMAEGPYQSFSHLKGLVEGR